MANKKIQHEVESKGLDPRIPHFLLGEDKKLLISSVPQSEELVQQQTEPVVVEISLETTEQSSETIEEIQTLAEPAVEEVISANAKPKRIPPGRKPKPKPIEEG